MTLSRAAFLACTMMLTTLSQGARADFVYAFKEYPSLQNGYTIAGTITVGESAVSSGELTRNDITALSISVTKGGVTYTTVSSADIPSTFVFLVHINASQIYLQATSTQQSIFNVSHPGGSSALGWAQDIKPPFTLATNHLNVVQDGGSNIISSTAATPFGTPFVIAELQTSTVPEPTSLVLAITAIGGLGLGAVWRRRKR
jgi:hypothetical protein